MKKDKISCWDVKLTLKVRTKAQAIELDKAIVDLYNTLVSKWTGVKKKYIKNKYSIAEERDIQIIEDIILPKNWGKVNGENF